MEISHGKECQVQYIYRLHGFTGSDTMDDKEFVILSRTSTLLSSTASGAEHPNINARNHRHFYRS
jgi:hypothetical protein